MTFMIFSRRVLSVLIGGGILLVILLVLLSQRPVYTQGSSFSRTPSGYGAWVAAMAAQDTPVDPWLKPFNELPGDEATTVIQVYPEEISDITDEQDRWIRAGNTLIVLGVHNSVTDAPFRSILSTDWGEVAIETTERYPAELIEKADLLLADDYGAIAWREAKGKGYVYFSTTPYLAANAYQDPPGNFALLADWATQAGSRIYKDDYLHGYRDADSAAQEVKGSVVAYLAATPWLPVLVQVGGILGIMIVAMNQRFGPPVHPQEVEPANSQAYVEALAQVLTQAQSAHFVVSVVGKAEQIALQQALGLGSKPVSTPTLLQAWQQQTGEDPQPLERILTLIAVSGQPTQDEWGFQRPVSPRRLRQWLQALAHVRQRSHQSRPLDPRR